MQRAHLVIPEDKLKPLVVGDTVFRSAYDLHITEADLKLAYEELGETESLRNECLESLRKKLPVEADALPDLFFLRFLRYSKFDVERAHHMIRKLHQRRSEYNEIYQSSPKLERILESNFARYLPYRDEEGISIFWVQFKHLNVDEICLKDLMNFVTIIGDLYSLKPSFQINSTLDVWDMDGMTMRHCTLLFSLSNFRSLLKFVLDTYPWRIKRIILINCNVLFRKMFDAIRYLIKKKMANRIVLLGSDLTELHQYLNPALYPKEYGGNIDDREFCMKDFIMENMPYLKYQGTIKLAD